MPTSEDTRVAAHFAFQRNCWPIPNTGAHDASHNNEQYRSRIVHGRYGQCLNLAVFKVSHVIVFSFESTPHCRYILSLRAKSSSRTSLISFRTAHHVLHSRSAHRRRCEGVSPNRRLVHSRYQLDGIRQRFEIRSTGQRTCVCFNGRGFNGFKRE